MAESSFDQVQNRPLVQDPNQYLAENGHTYATQREGRDASRTFGHDILDEISGNHHSGYDPTSDMYKPQDPNHYNLGGSADWVGKYTKEQNADAQAADKRALDQGNYNTAAGQVAGATNAFRDAAMGNGPSVAQAQMAQGLGQSQQNAMSVAASARGGGANLAAANRAAMQANSQGAQNAVQQNAALRAQEIAQARQGWAGGAQTMQQGALGQQSNQMQQMGLNDSRYNADQGRAYQAVNQQTQNNMHLEDTEADSYKTAMGLKQAKETGGGGGGSSSILSGVGSAATAIAGLFA
jgi:hypothetical protein